MTTKVYTSNKQSTQTRSSTAEEMYPSNSKKSGCFGMILLPLMGVVSLIGWGLIHLT